MPRFVILEHDHPTLHWDFMLEVNGVLKTWRLPEAPRNHGQTMEAEALGDHRLAYLDYEGPVSGERGTVRCWERGTYVWIPEREVTVWEVQLESARLTGTVFLVHRAGATWDYSFQPSEAQGPR